ncbi:MAG: hypothetical protein HQ462_11700 [Deltaproteobacteria bacterium]|nr:hypothetical protein [Deltaproteobacteria bacterium]
MKIVKYYKLFFILLSMSLSYNGLASEKLEEQKMNKRFGVGVAAAGPLSVLGLEFDVNITEQISVSGGLGTGLDYSTFTIKGKYFLLGDKVSPYFGVGLARWWTDGTKETNLNPGVLKNKFLSGNDYSKGFDIWMIYPSIGVQYLHPMGISFYAEAQALFKIPNLANGTYAGLGSIIYF